jgi:hypothetical protein
MPLMHGQGARLVYTKYLRQWLLKYQPKIDVVLEKVGGPGRIASLEELRSRWQACRPDKLPDHAASGLAYLPPPVARCLITKYRWGRLLALSWQSTRSLSSR